MTPSAVSQRRGPLGLGARQDGLVRQLELCRGRKRRIGARQREHLGKMGVEAQRMERLGDLFLLECWKRRRLEVDVDIEYGARSWRRDGS